MPISTSQGQALTALLGTLRKDWGLPGIAAAVRKAALTASAADVAVAACRCAADPDMRTPGLIPSPGPHWQGLTAGSRLAPVMCSNHPAHKAGGCPECWGERKPRPASCVAPRPARPIVRVKVPEVADLSGARDRADAEVGT